MRIVGLIAAAQFVVFAGAVCVARHPPHSGDRAAASAPVKTSADVGTRRRRPAARPDLRRRRPVGARRPGRRRSHGSPARAGNSRAHGGTSPMSRAERRRGPGQPSSKPTQPSRDDRLRVPRAARDHRDRRDRDRIAHAEQRGVRRADVRAIERRPARAGLQRRDDPGPFNLPKADHKPVLLEVFATWCPHCQHEVSVLNPLFHQYGDKVHFVAVSGSPYGAMRSARRRKTT